MRGNTALDPNREIREGVMVFVEQGVEDKENLQSRGGYMRKHAGKERHQGLTEEEELRKRKEERGEGKIENRIGRLLGGIRCKEGT